MELTQNQKDILNHTATRTANRLYCGDSPDMQILVKKGLMQYAGKTAFCPDKYFRLTPRGKQIAV